jgi:uncharacterized membrane protein HdeD (DUF308 family)
MRQITRIKNLLIGLIMIALAASLLAFPQYGPGVIVLLIGIGLILSGIGSLIFYITMARHMVGGMKTFYRSILFLDLGVFMMTGFAVSEQLVLLYLMGILVISGGIDIIRALEFKKEGASWKARMVSGVISLVIMVIGTIFMDNPLTVVYLFCLGLLYSAVTRIVSAFRKTAVIYIPE